MRAGFFARLAAGNIRKNGKTYLPYLLTCIVTTAFFYIVKSLSLNPGLEKMVGDQTLAYTMYLGSWIVGLFAFIFLFYTNGFLVKQRKKEFAVFEILGMEKRHLAATLAWETLYVTLLSLAAGLILGIALDKVMFLLILKVIDADISLGFFISGKAVAGTLVLFASVFFLIYVKTVFQIKAANPAELLREQRAGEREPKTKWAAAALGMICVAAGYYLALTTENPIASIFIFFMAVVLVIAGTYLLFTAGSIAFLKTLKRNRAYYYKTRHFISVSGMIYRMKQNAVGLANICVLSTMVLVMVSTTGSLMIGMSDIITTRYPNDFVIYSDEATEERSREMCGQVKQLQREQGLSVTNEVEYTYLGFAAIRDKDTYHVTREGSLAVVDSVNNLFFVPLSDYNAAMGCHETLKKGEILLYSNRSAYQEPVLKIFDRKYQVKKRLDHFVGKGIIAANIASSQFIVVPDLKEIRELYELQKQALGEIAGNIRYFYGFDMDAGEEEQQMFFEKLRRMFTDGEYQGTVESRQEAKTSFIGLYGGFFFIGIFLGILFVMATVLIIYYKQISEGYDDRERFVIMQKVGMSHQEVKASIHSQVLTVFFLPLIVAGIHVAAAFPLISKLLALLNLTNTGLYVVCTMVCFLVFTAMYLAIYLLTAKTYYRIVSR